MPIMDAQSMERDLQRSQATLNVSPEIAHDRLHEEHERQLADLQQQVIQRDSEIASRDELLTQTREMGRKLIERVKVRVPFSIDLDLLTR